MLDVRLGLMAFVGALWTQGAFAQNLLDNPLDSGEDKPHATLRLATETERLAPGEAEIAVLFEIDRGWHLYWRNPGDTGLPPTIEFDLPEGVELAGEMRWPAPKRYIHGGGRLLDYIYEKELALLQPVRIDSPLAGPTESLEGRGAGPPGPGCTKGPRRPRRRPGISRSTG